MSNSGLTKNVDELVFILMVCLNEFYKFCKTRITRLFRYKILTIDRTEETCKERNDKFVFYLCQLK